jgi:2-succinyl-5-enolpyruvyl-6-hydroxy-3-cyclohexene-1-carboxylate synthase
MSVSPAADWSVAFIRELIASGVEHIVVSPGARSQSLALAALSWEKVNGSPLTVHVVVDERSAGFRALGLARESQRPVVCVSTSGSAPAHYYPAVLEAWHQGISLIMVTADRPGELHGVGANQTTKQENLFGPAISSLMVPAPEVGDDATKVARTAARLAYRPQPVQVNVAFREPLSAAMGLTEKDLPEVSVPEPDRPAFRSLVVQPELGTLVIAGSGAGARAETWARELGAPLIAEVESQARFGPHLVPAYREVLTHSPLVAKISRVITVGRPTLSREIWELLGRTDLWHIAVVGAHREGATPSGVATVVDDITVETDPHQADETAWVSSWVRPWVKEGRKIQEALIAQVTPPPADVAALESSEQAVRSAFATQEMNVLRESISRASLALGVWEATWPHDRLVLGASRMIRELDRIAPGKNIQVRANRGLSGIDGTIATARGIADGAWRQGASGVTRVMLGDLAFLHDVGSLMVEPGTTAGPRVHLIVANDGGGSIFDLLESAEGVSQEDRDRVLYTPQEVDISALARAYGWEYHRVANRGDLAEALSRGDQRLIIDVELPRYD